MDVDMKPTGASRAAPARRSDEGLSQGQIASAADLAERLPSDEQRHRGAEAS